MRPFARTATVLLLTLGALLFNAGDIVDPWHPYGTFGFTTDTAGVVTSVDSYAAARGIRLGDRVAAAKMALDDRVYLTSLAAAAPGRHITVPLVSGRTVMLTAHAQPRSLADNITDILGVLVLITYAVLATVLVLLRPMPATWAFYLFSYYFLYNGAQNLQYFPAWLDIALSFVVSSVSQVVSAVAFFSFALRFPDTRPAGTAAVLERALLFVVLPVLALGYLACNVGILFAAPVPQWLSNIPLAVVVALYLPGIAVLFSRYAWANTADRARLRWVVGAFTIAFIPILADNSAQFVLGYSPSITAGNIAQAWLIIAPVALAYTVLKHRLFDIRFVVSRALVYGFLTTLTVGILALADWGLGKWLEQSRFQMVAEVALAVAIGFSLTSVHARIERFLNGFIFRAQMLALAAVRRFTHEIDLITEPGQLLEQTYATLHARIECSYVTIYTSEGSTYAKATHDGSTLPALLSANDLAVLRLRRWHEPFECDVPDHPLRGALLLPMTLRTHLVGFIACGPKADRTHYLPDEVATLEALSHRCGAAYAWLTLRPSGDALVPASVTES